MLYSLPKKDWYACQHPTPKDPYTVYLPSSVSNTETPTLKPKTARTANMYELGMYKSFLSRNIAALRGRASLLHS